MTRYEFTITIAGCGDTPAEAWDEATEAFAADPGPCPDETEYTVEEDENDETTDQ